MGVIKSSRTLFLLLRPDHPKVNPRNRFVGG